MNDSESGRPRGRRAASGAGAESSADLVSVNPGGKVEVEHGSGRGKGIYWVLRHVLLGPMVTKIFRPVVEGTENVPETGAAILASNHLSFADWLFMPLALDRRVTFVAKSDYFTGGRRQGLGPEAVLRRHRTGADRPDRRQGQRERPAGRT
jgi:1-acyl-sn-glycerol-3-phosphate acyltransferase